MTNRYLIPLLLQSKYLITEQNLAVHSLWTLYIVDHEGINWLFPLQVFQLQLQLTDLIYVPKTAAIMHFRGLVRPPA